MADNLIVTTGAAWDVPNEFTTMQSTSWNAIDEARQALDRMSGSVNFPQVSIAPGTVTSSITYNPPSDKPTWDYNFNLPQWAIPDPVLSDVNKITVDDFTGAPPTAVSPSLPTKPNPISPTAPGDAPILSPVTLPDAPVLSDIPDPKEWVITIPTAPDINIPGFSGAKPDSSNIAIPTSAFNWMEDPYTSNTLTQIVGQVQSFLSGGVGIPDVVWEALWAKENDKENRAANKLIDEINEEWSSRGFQLPQGVQTAKVQEVRQEVQKSSVSRARDIAIKEADLEIENLKFAVQQGIALENLRGSWYQNTINRSLDAAKYTADLAINVFNAEVSLYNAQAQTYLADLQAYKAEIDAEVTKLDAYRTELEGQKILGDLNRQEIEIYTAKVQALNLEIDRYTAMLQGVKIATETDAIKIDAYKAEVQAYAEKIQAINSEYQGYATAMQGSKIESDIFRANVEAYASTVQAYATKIDASAKNSAIDIDINKYKLEEYNLKIQGFIANLEASMKEIEANSVAFESKNKAYMAGLEAEKVSIQAQTAKYTGDVQLAQQVTQANITAAQANSQNAVASTKIVQSGLEAIAKVNGAYAGSALSAVNVSMGITDSANNSASA